MFDNILKLYSAVEAKDWGNAAKFLGLVIQQVGEWYGGRLAPPEGGLHVIAAPVGLAAVKANLQAAVAAPHPAGASVDPATLLTIINLVIKAIDWWQARQK